MNERTVSAEKLLEKGATLADILALFAMPILASSNASDSEAATVPPPKGAR